mmetsp:Transcript_93770/g.183863  ORF Transcript_93770/g.183863 Transcript_93770/m.183863 type:complete len:213 (-) Transcript_93770:350-988(-)
MQADGAADDAAFDDVVARAYLQPADLVAGLGVRRVVDPRGGQGAVLPTAQLRLAEAADARLHPACALGLAQEKLARLGAVVVHDSSHVDDLDAPPRQFGRHAVGGALPLGWRDDVGEPRLRPGGPLDLEALALEGQVRIAAPVDVRAAAVQEVRGLAEFVHHRGPLLRPARRRLQLVQSQQCVEEALPEPLPNRRREGAGAVVAAVVVGLHR